ncbi:hypothetical protein KFL_008360070 [Klebsormidium nitens]|uniref:Uncharacterized protein n=1 Tax=Klebsormidium nitens TaxID=105231 RepID=A0A1Y1IQF1_KLENI|nr:hypothetical protein KFL_008360070 [Klebsormidium nitens]|eukprot:GAQ91699.1 hypothetical protein KFL_008360070 [Klebsormidium nitens]
MSRDERLIKALEDLQKRQDARRNERKDLRASLTQFLNIFLGVAGIIFGALAQSSRLTCQHVWIPSVLLTLAGGVTSAGVWSRLERILGDFNIKKFDLNKIKDHKSIVIIGRRGTGKTTLITDILYRKRDLPAGLVMSGTEDGNSYYRQFIPDTFIYGAYDEDVICKLIARQKNMKRLNAKHSECFLLLDDCLFNPKILKGDTMRFLFMNGRHFNITLILAAQWVMDIPPAIRANSDYVFVFNDPIVNNRKRFFEHYFGVFRSFQQFEAVYKACTSDFECMVLDNTLQSSNPEDCIFWYKAQIHKPFKLGAPEYWSFHKKCYGQEDNKSSITEVNGVRIRKSK